MIAIAPYRFEQFHLHDHILFPFQKKEPVGADDALPDSVTSNLEGLTKEACEPLTVTQIKRIRVLIDEAVEKVI